MMTQAPLDKIWTSRIKFVVLILIAVVPIFIASAAFFFFPDWAPTETTNRGELIVPVVPGEEISGELLELNSWVLLQPVAMDCNEDCIQMLYLSRQVIKGLGKDASRIKRAVIAPAGISARFADLLESDHSDAQIIEADTRLLDQTHDSRPVLFLMDPNGNVLMYYSLEKAGKPMMKDLKHLLKVSNIG